MWDISFAEGFRDTEPSDTPIYQQLLNESNRTRPSFRSHLRVGALVVAALVLAVLFTVRGVW